jgi:hypothetical protein
VFENRALRSISGPKRDEVKVGRENCIQRSCMISILRVEKDKVGGHVARMGRRTYMPY